MRLRIAWLNLFLKIVTDVVMIGGAFISAFLLKSGSLSGLMMIQVYYKPLFFITVLWLVVLNLAGLYKLQTDKLNRVDNVLAVSFGAFSAAFFAYVFIAFLYREASYSKDIVILGSLLALVLINLSRYFIWKIFQREK
jgi:hypothetical protein